MQEQNNSVTYDVNIQFKSYVAQPYWPSQARVIELEKRSGCNRCKSEEKRETSLLSYLKSQNVSKAEFDDLKKLAARPWYRLDDANQESEIVIPTLQFYGCLVQASTSAPAGAKVQPDQLRSLITLSPFRTGKYKCDRTDTRWIANELSSQKRVHTDEVIDDFLAQGTVEINPDFIKGETVEKLVRYAVQYIGVGGARKMGFGRGILLKFDKQHGKK